ncbi:MAG: M3 family metallopeptidase [Bacteroidales bacterium]|nr:M3 family metallopeptidase [Bacteroidales bacterium]
MNRKQLLAVSFAALTLLATGCKKNMDNPFLTEWGTPYEIPNFEQIKPEHYMPAFEEGMKQQLEAIDAIVNNAEEPTFENTIVAYEYSADLLNKVSGVFFNLSGVERTDETDMIEEKVIPMLSAHGDNVALNAKLFARIKAVYDKREGLGLNQEQMRLVEKTYNDFVRGGANVPEAQQARFRELNEQIASLTNRFEQNVLKATNAYKLVLDEAKATSIGLSEGQLAAAKELGNESEETKGQYVFNLQMPSWEPFMQNCSDRELRKQMWEAYSTRCNGGEFDNAALIDSIVNARIERAQILGFKSHADYVLDDCLAKTPEAVNGLLMQIWTPALKKAKEECAAYQKMILADLGAGAKIEPYDWRYYCEKLRKEQYDLDEEEVRQYFSLDNVRQGAFDLATKLYGITFEENQNLPNYHKGLVTPYEVKENGETIGILYMEWHPRESKASGAWMTEIRGQHKDINGNNQIPIIMVCCNFTKPSGDRPSLLTADESETLFHEFGHALHGLLSKCTYPSLAGTSVPRDFVELPSQVMENWCRNSTYRKTFAKHYKTGEIIPDALIAKLEAAATYGQGFINTELLAASLLDIHYYSLTEKQPIDVNVFEDNYLKSIGLIPEIISRYKSTYFKHIFTTGYDAGYYSYTWTAVLDHDAFAAFQESGDIFNADLAKKFRHILESGNTEDPMQMYLAFRGQEPSVTPLLRDRGLL